MRAISNVHVTDPDTGLRVVINEGDEIPEKYADAITNPKVTGLEPKSSDSESKDPGDVGEGPLDKRKVGELRALAAAANVDVADARNKEEIVELLTKAGVEA